MSARGPGRPFSTFRASVLSPPSSTSAPVGGLSPVVRGRRASAGMVTRVVRPRQQSRSPARESSNSSPAAVRFAGRLAGAVAGGFPPRPPQGPPSLPSRRSLTPSHNPSYVAPSAKKLALGDAGRLNVNLRLCDGCSTLRTTGRAIRNTPPGLVASDKNAFGGVPPTPLAPAAPYPLPRCGPAAGAIAASLPHEDRASVPGPTATQTPRHARPRREEPSM